LVSSPEVFVLVGGGIVPKRVSNRQWGSKIIIHISFDIFQLVIGCGVASKWRWSQYHSAVACGLVYLRLVRPEPHATALWYWLHRHRSSSQWPT